MDLHQERKAQAEQIIGYSFIAIGILGIVAFNATLTAVIIFVIVGLLGVGFDSLAYMRKVPKASRLEVAKVLRGYPFSLPALWIENFLGFKDGNSDL